jgi:putative SOS response-associated peptidase YedK
MIRCLLLLGYGIAGRDRAGEVIETCSVLTTRPNAVVADVHDRLPAVLKPEDYDLWFDPGMRDAAGVTVGLKPFDPSLMKKYPVSTQVNRAENDDQECAREVSLRAPLRDFSENSKRSAG